MLMRLFRKITSGENEPLLRMNLEMTFQIKLQDTVMNQTTDAMRAKSATEVKYAYDCIAKAYNNAVTKNPFENKLAIVVKIKGSSGEQQHDYDCASMEDFHEYLTNQHLLPRSNRCLR